MRITVNRALNVAYVHFQDRPDTVTTQKLSDDLYVDMGSDGTVYGLEFLNAKEQLRTALWPYGRGHPPRSGNPSE